MIFLLLAVNIFINYGLLKYKNDVDEIAIVLFCIDNVIKINREYNPYVIDKFCVNISSISMSNKSLSTTFKIHLISLTYSEKTIEKVLKELKRKMLNKFQTIYTMLNF